MKRLAFTLSILTALAAASPALAGGSGCPGMTTAGTGSTTTASTATGQSGG